MPPDIGGAQGSLPPGVMERGIALEDMPYHAAAEGFVPACEELRATAESVQSRGWLGFASFRLLVRRRSKRSAC